MAAYDTRRLSPSADEHEVRLKARAAQLRSELGADAAQDSLDSLAAAALALPAAAPVSSAVQQRPPPPPPPPRQQRTNSPLRAQGSWLAAQEVEAWQGEVDPSAPLWHLRPLGATPAPAPAASGWRIERASSGFSRTAETRVTFEPAMSSSGASHQPTRSPSRERTRMPTPHVMAREELSLRRASASWCARQLRRTRSTPKSGASRSTDTAPAPSAQTTLSDSAEEEDQAIKRLAKEAQMAAERQLVAASLSRAAWKQRQTAEKEAEEAKQRLDEKVDTVFLAA